MAGFHRCLETAGVPFRHIQFPAPAETGCVKTPPTATNTGNPHDVQSTGSSDRNPPSRGKRRPAFGGAAKDEAFACATLPPYPAKSGRRALFQDEGKLVGDGTARLWSQPGEVERVRVCVVGRGATAEEGGVGVSSKYTCDPRY
ncbi:unnamed protein product [Sphacelaria rigidula]